jgi:predicted MFS family arabinose efflux permease
MTFSYISAIVEGLDHAGPSELSIMVSLMGIASAVGSLVGGRSADSLGPGRTIIVGLSLQILCTFALAASGWVRPGDVPVIAIAFLLAGWGIFGGTLYPPLQSRLLSVAKDAGNEVVALNSSALFLGISLSGALGGLVLSNAGSMAVPAIAGLIAAVSVPILAWAFSGDVGTKSTAGGPA